MRNLFAGLFQKKPEDRLGFESPLQIKSHPWFQKVDWDAISNKNVVPPFIPIIQSESDT
jgi:hypothetical protein